MCGIAGYFGDIRKVGDARTILSGMNAAIGHRGPDENDVHVGKGAGLAHTRLSIVGLSDGQQPMANADGTVWISFNGEVFNYVELRNELIAKGRRFRTGSDTEVILQLYDEMGTDCVDRLNGDFAFAIWDEKRQRMMLARDRMGVRPLFHTLHKGVLFFASEVKALLSVPGIGAEMDPIALDQIFTLWAPIAPRTSFKGISELPPAHRMIVDPRNSEIEPYWRLSFPDRDEHLSLAQRSAGRRRIARPSRRCNAHPLARRCSGRRLSFGRARFLDRLRHGAAAGQGPLAHLLGDLRFSPNMTRARSSRKWWRHSARGIRRSPAMTATLPRIFPDVVRATERPVIRTAPAPLFLLSDLVRKEGFKVVLTGEGADEVFAGYDIFKEAAVRRFCARNPVRASARISSASSIPISPASSSRARIILPPSSAPVSTGSMIRSFSHGPRLRGTAAAKMFYSGELRAQLKGYDAAADLAANLPPEFPRWHPLHQAQYLETAFLLPGYILSSQGDRMAMAHGVEGRFPFLDHRLVEFAARIPTASSSRASPRSISCAQATKDLLPASIAKRHQAALSRAGQPVLQWRGGARLCRGGARAQCSRRLRTLQSQRRRQALRQMPAPGHFRLPRQCRLYRRAVEPALVPRICRGRHDPCIACRLKQQF